MTPADRAKLTASLRDHVARLAEDLRAQMRAPGPVRHRARTLHADEQVGEDFDVWTDLLARRAAVLWVLKSVYVRVLEDRGLLASGRILDVEGQQLFERLAPNLGETAFLRWVYRDLANPRGGLPELFSPQPAEITWPSDALSREWIRSRPRASCRRTRRPHRLLEDRDDLWRCQTRLVTVGGQELTLVELHPAAGQPPVAHQRRQALAIEGCLEERNEQVTRVLAIPRYGRDPAPSDRGKRRRGVRCCAGD